MIAFVIAASIVVAAMVWASRMAERKHRSSVWRLVVFLWAPLVLLLWCLPDKEPLAVVGLSKKSAVSDLDQLVSKQNPIRQSSFIKWGVFAVVIGGLAYGWNVGWFEPLPTKCDDFSAWRLNSVYENSLPGRFGMMKILVVEQSADTGSKVGRLSCDIKTLTTSGEMRFIVTTRPIGETVYIEMQPQLFN
jgi:hypothetical protein